MEPPLSKPEVMSPGFPRWVAFAKPCGWSTMGSSDTNAFVENQKGIQVQGLLLSRWLSIKKIFFSPSTWIRDPQFYSTIHPSMKWHYSKFRCKSWPILAVLALLRVTGLAILAKREKAKSAGSLLGEASLLRKTPTERQRPPCAAGHYHTCIWHVERHVDAPEKPIWRQAESLPIHNFAYFKKSPH